MSEIGDFREGEGKREGRRRKEMEKERGERGR